MEDGVAIKGGYTRGKCSIPLPRRVLDEAQENFGAAALQELRQLRPGLGQERLRDAPVRLDGDHRGVQSLRADIDRPRRHESTLRNSSMHVSKGYPVHGVFYHQALQSLLDWLASRQHVCVAFASMYQPSPGTAPMVT